MYRNTAYQDGGFSFKKIRHLGFYVVALKAQPTVVMP
jgi:hypothetical protein